MLGSILSLQNQNAQKLSLILYLINSAA